MSPSVLTSKSPTKAQDARERLLAMAQQLGPNAKMPTVQQLRRELQVSITTLDTVLTQLEHQNIIFRKQGSGIFVSPRLSQKCVGLVCDPAFFQAGTSPFWQQLVESAQSRASIGGEAFRFYLAIPSIQGDYPIHDDLIEDVQASRIQGVLFVGNNVPAQEWFRENGVPSVVFAGRGDYIVRISYESLVQIAADHLYAKGCRNLALLVPGDTTFEDPHDPLDSYPAHGFVPWLEEHGLPVRQGLVWEANAKSRRGHRVPETRQEQGYEAVLEIFRSNQTPPDGLICTDDMMTRGVLAGFRKLGLRPGRDVQLVSHINRGSTVLHGEDGDISLVEVNPAEIVQRMFDQLEILMDGRTPAEHEIIVQPQLLS
jgi:DNA-binding LacI/PurR family transcriptional regulator